MKKKNRDINIFSMSALDLFASAMGAFLLIAVMALPYYLKVDPDLIKQAQEAEAKANQAEQEKQVCEEKRAECEQARSQYESERTNLEAQNKTLSEENAALKANQGTCEEEKRKLEAENDALKDKNKECQKKLQKSFCVVTIKWESSKEQDVDLHIIDPRGREYYYNKLTHGGSAFFAVDSKGVKKGAEVWVDKELKPGKYKIYYVYYAGSSPVTIKGSVLTSSFTTDLKPKRLTSVSTDRKIKIATIVVNENGQARLEEH